MPYRTAPRAPEPIPDLLLLELERRARRARRIGIVSVAAIALGVLVILGTGRHLATTSRRALETEYAELIGCLDGQRPDRGTTERVRRRQLAEMDTPPEERDLDRWPMSCRSYARHLQESAFRAKLLGLSSIAGSLHGKLSRFDALSEDLAPAIQDLLVVAGELGLDDLRPIVHAAPPEPAAALTLVTPSRGQQALSGVRSLDILMAKEEPNPSSRVVFWAHESLICAASATEHDLRCANHQFGWVGGSSAEDAELDLPAVAHDSRTFPYGTLWAAKTCTEPCKPQVIHGHTMSQHAYAVLDLSREGGSRLEWHTREDTTGEQALQGRGKAALVFDELVASGERGLLMHARLDADGRPERLRAIDGGAGFHPTQQGCTGSGTFALRIAGTDDDAIVFRDESGLHEPVRTIRGGRLVCSHDGVAWVVRPNEQWPGQIVVSRCTAAGCSTQQIDRKDLDRNDPALRATRWIESGILDDKLLVVWTAGDRGGLRMRLAPADRFAKSRDVVLLDNRPPLSGRPPELEAVRVFVRDRFALVVLGTSEGPRVIRIEPDGSFGFVDAVWARAL